MLDFGTQVFATHSACGWLTCLAGQEDYDKLRPLSYPQTDVFVILYDISNRPSFEHVITKWVPEIKSYPVAHFLFAPPLICVTVCPTTPYLLVGTKVDLREQLELYEDMLKKPVISFIKLHLIIFIWLADERNINSLPVDSSHSTIPVCSNRKDAAQQLLKRGYAFIKLEGLQDDVQTLKDSRKRLFELPVEYKRSLQGQVCSFFFCVVFNNSLD